LLQDASQAIHHNSQVKFFIGAAEVLSRLRLLGVEELRPGEDGWLQIELAEPVVAVRGDRYILRRPSPGETLGGGTVVDPFPTRRHKRFSRELIDRLVALAAGSPADVLLQALIAAGTAPFRDVIARTQLGEASSIQAVEELYASGQMIYPEGGQHQPSPAWDGLVASRGYWDQLTGRAILELEGFHRANPLRRGMPKEELKSRLKTSPRVFAAVIGDLASHHRLQEAGPLVVLPGFEIRFNAEQERAVQNLMQRFGASGYSPPSVKECQSEAGEVVYAALIETGRLLQVSSDVVFSRDGYDQMLRAVMHLLDEHGTITAAQVRDYFNTSRKYVLAFLEHLDGIGMTVRDGDVRRRRT
jgi:selenocysteine-specific elongation factor